MNAALEPVEAMPDRITPHLDIRDALASYWFSQVILRLRREIAWCWYQRMPQEQGVTGSLPPVTDATLENLDLVRYAKQKRAFFNNDSAAHYLSDAIAALGEPPSGVSGYWQQLCAQFQLDESTQFVLALALAARLDSGLAPLFATCMNDLSRPFPTLALAQRLWDEPGAIIACADSEHPLFRFGLLKNINDNNGGHPWQRPLDLNAVLAQQLIDPDADLPRGLKAVETNPAHVLSREAEVLVARLNANHNDHMQIVPLMGPKAAAFADWAAVLCTHMGRKVVTIDRHLLDETDYVSALATISCLRGLDIVLPENCFQQESCKQHTELLAGFSHIPLIWYLPVNDYQELKHIPSELLTPPFVIENLSFQERIFLFKKYLGLAASQLECTIEICARRFRFQEPTIASVASTFKNEQIPLTANHLITACANEAVIEMGHLAQAVSPRFSPDELILPDEQSRQFNDVLHAMRSLTVVHYHWGTARVWNESGLSVLFCGAPGTGKTMAAEALAFALKLPMFRVDLSQVVNKYIGETEKNLKRIFDAAELSDCILFFDEADALFGKRTDVKDAHDRFANIEISYLLERMERFKGLAILATNRRKDLDEAFMRRLRYLIEFPVPGVTERRRIWENIFPASVDVAGLDFHYLARQFQLSGGHIRSVAFNACLRAADETRPEDHAKISMADVVMSVKRELEKMNRTASAELFGDYSYLLEDASA